MPSPAGRFAPSPTGELHLGNVRTAVVAWLTARSRHRDFIVRMEDLDRVTSSPAHEVGQLRDLATLGIDWDGTVVRQSERFHIYDAAIAELAAAGRTYECFCTRREIREAISAPHGEQVPVLVDGPEPGPAAVVADGCYPGTCRALTAARAAQLRAEGRRPAIRLRADAARVLVTDELHGAVEGIVDDVVLRRNDGVPAYNLAVVVDDAAQGVVEVVRGDDLLSSTPRQVLLQRLLGLPTPTYLHVPLVVGPDGSRLAKRHGAVTLADLAAAGVDTPAALTMVAVSLGLADRSERVTTAGQLLDRFDPAHLPRLPWVLPENLQRSAS